MQYVVKAPFVKVSIGSPGGNRVASILRAGAIVPEGVDETQLKALAARGLLEQLGGEVPNKSAKVGDWRAYVVAAGLATEEQAAKATKEDLVTLVEGPPAAPPAPPVGPPAPPVDPSAGGAANGGQGDGQE